LPLVIVTYPRRLWRLLRTACLVWLCVNVLLGIVIAVHGRSVPLERADVIIVLGSGLNRDGSAGPALTRRASHAAALWTARQAPVVLCTGGQTPGFPRSEASACRAILIARGVPDTAIHLEARSRSTEENALYSRDIMRAQGWRTSVLVTDPYHMLRAGWLFDQAGISQQPAPVARDQIATGWYVNRIGREVIALQWHALKMLLSRGR
jgi:uncharacterized SAM-binding protein YcdF (DUF218 family)